MQIIATLGPSSLNKKTLKYLKKDVNLFRLNMSHLSLGSLEENLIFLKKNKVKNICIDTEGAQIRTSNCRKKILKKNSIIFLTDKSTNKNNYIQLYPNLSVSKVRLKSTVKIGFEGLELRVLNKFKNNLRCIVIKEGVLEKNKGVHFQSDIALSPLTNKDLGAIEIAKKYKIKTIALSFVNSSNDVRSLRKLLTKDCKIISKIETKKGFLNRRSICKVSDAILIDRGDLSRYINISEIPLAQRIIIKDSKSLNKQVFVATNLLETMIVSNSPTRAESNDVFSTLESGCAGLVLAAETAIGKYPEECISFLKSCLRTFNKKKNYIINNKLFFK